LASVRESNEAVSSDAASATGDHAHHSDKIAHHQPAAGSETGPFARKFCQITRKIHGKKLLSVGDSLPGTALMIAESTQSDFSKFGFALVENVIEPNSLANLKENLSRLWREAKRGRVDRIRVYEDYPRLFGGLNVAAVEDPFFYVPALKEWIRSAGFEKTIAELSGWPGAELELARLHMNGRFKYQGFWHRDATVDKAEVSVVAVIYFEPEGGFRVAPSASKWSSATENVGDELQKQYFHGPLEGEHVIAAPAGSAFFFKSYLLHRGYNSKPRLHLHLRFVRSTDYNTERWAEYRDKGPIFDKNSSTRIGRLRQLIRYCLPLPNRSSIFQS
jgi:hypothetical protein